MYHYTHPSVAHMINNRAQDTLACESETTELSSLMASSTKSLLGRSFFLRMAVARSSSLLTDHWQHSPFEVIFMILAKTYHQPIWLRGREEGGKGGREEVCVHACVHSKACLTVKCEGKSFQEEKVGSGERNNYNREAEKEEEDSLTTLLPAKESAMRSPPCW